MQCQLLRGKKYNKTLRAHINNNPCYFTSDTPPSSDEIKVKTPLPISSSTATLVAENDDVSNSNCLSVVRKPNQSTVVASTTKASSNKDSECKKREDLTSLGSDDSGMIAMTAAFCSTLN